MNETNLVYGLRDPRNDTYYYIGKTTIGIGRPLTHLALSHNNDVNIWVNGLRELELEPEIDIIESDIPLHLLTSREIHWITKYSNVNNCLLNKQLLNKNYIDLDFNKFNQVIETLNNIDILSIKIRGKFNLNQEQLAKICGITRSTVSLIETNKNKNVPISTIIKILSITKDNINQFNFTKSKKPKNYKKTSKINILLGGEPQ